MIHMQTDPHKPDPLDAWLEEDMRDIRTHSFQQTMRVARTRRHCRQIMMWTIPLLLMLAVAVSLDRQDGSKTSATNLVMHSQPPSRQFATPSASTLKQKAPSNIPTLSDAEFEKIMKGYPLAIIRKGGQTLYVPLD